jgi:hypothetical protein
VLEYKGTVFGQSPTTGNGQMVMGQNLDWLLLTVTRTLSVIPALLITSMLRYSCCSIILSDKKFLLGFGLFLYNEEKLEKQNPHGIRDSRQIIFWEVFCRIFGNFI